MPQKKVYPPFWSIFWSSLRKIQPKYLARNPMLLLVFFLACLATIMLIRELDLNRGNIALYFQLSFWIWMTLYFSAFADSYAESKMHYYEEEKEIEENNTLLARITNLKKPDIVTKIKYQDVRSGHLLILKSGDMVPFDGRIISGKCYVNETDITGELENQYKHYKHDDILTAGSIIQDSQNVIMKVSFAKKISFFSRTMQHMKQIRREYLPSELALQRLILGISILFISVIFTVWTIAKYSGFDIPLIYLIDLVVILLPTTISGLQHAIIIFGKAKLSENGIIVHDLISLDNIVDASILLIDKTGTLTIGKREMADFSLTDNIEEADFLKYLYLSSIEDKTIEGLSIKNYSQTRLDDLPSINQSNYQFFAFSNSKPISGCDYENLSIRKGSVSEICKYLGLKSQQLPSQVKYIITSIASSHGTPLLITLNSRLIGIIHLRDKFRKSIQKQIDKLKKQHLKLAILTGDNAETTNFVAEKLAIDNVYYDATPEKKLDIVRSMQAEGYIVAMCGDGINDSLALAQADIGFTFERKNDLHPIMAGNIISKYHDLSNLIKFKNICKKMTVKRGALTVFSLSSDISKYFLIVPALFTTAFPPLSVLNFMNFQSLETVILASVMFNSLVILILTPILFRNFNQMKSKYSAWLDIIFYGIGGMISPIIFIKLLELLILKIGLL